jgi:carbon monoxide dehydrogenase subunit G
MKVSGTKEFDAPRKVVWDAISDPEGMARLMPGFESFEVQDSKHWRAKVKVPLGIGGLRMTIDFEQLDERPLELASLRAKGRGVGALMDMTTSFRLSGDDAHTSMDWEADVKMLGAGGAMGQRILQPVVHQQVDHVLAALEQRVANVQAG